MSTMNLRFAFEKETKGAVRFQEVGEDGKPLSEVQRPTGSSTTIANSAALTVPARDATARETL